MADFKAFSPSSWKAFTKKCSELFPFLKKQYNMTQTEWDALSTEDKVAMAGQNVVITDDDTPVDVVDTVEDGNMNPVTSNAVYDAITAVGRGYTVEKYYGSQTVSVDTFNKLTLVCASRYPHMAGAWLILNNYSSTPACIELGKASNSTMSVSASVDTTDTTYQTTSITVTANSTSYQWQLVQFNIA